SSTSAPRSASSEATRLLPAPIPPTRPTTGMGPCFQGPGAGCGSRPFGLRSNPAMLALTRSDSVALSGSLRPREPGTHGAPAFGGTDDDLDYAHRLAGSRRRRPGLVGTRPHTGRRAIVDGRKRRKDVPSWGFGSALVGSRG